MGWMPPSSSRWQHSARSARHQPPSKRRRDHVGLHQKYTNAAPIATFAPYRSQQQQLIASQSYWVCWKHPHHFSKLIDSASSSSMTPRSCYLTTKSSSSKQSTTNNSSLDPSSPTTTPTQKSRHCDNDESISPPSSTPPPSTPTPPITATLRIRKEILKQWWKDMQSLPNIITLSRIACTPLLSFWIVTGQAEYAFAGGLVAAMSDALDGYLAKRYNMTTVIGTFLDPLADKLLINVVSLSLYSISVLPGPLVLLWLTRDVALIYFTHRQVMLQSQHNPDIMYDLRKTPLQIQPTAISKINTALQFLTLGTALAHPMLVPAILPPYLLPGLCWITGATTVASAWSYIGLSGFRSSGNQPSSTDSARSKKS